MFTLQNCFPDRFKYTWLHVANSTDHRAKANTVSLKLNFNKAHLLSNLLTFVTVMMRFQNSFFPSFLHLKLSHPLTRGMSVSNVTVTQVPPVIIPVTAHWHINYLNTLQPQKACILLLLSPPPPPPPPVALVVSKTKTALESIMIELSSSCTGVQYREYLITFCHTHSHS